jgi:tetratricopeptide (TPR) repeat protein
MPSYRVSPSSGGSYTARETDAVEGAALGAAGLFGSLIGASVRAGAKMNQDRQDRRMAEALAAMDAAGENDDFDRLLSLATDFERRYPQNPSGAAYASMALSKLSRCDEALAAVNRSAQLGLDQEEANVLRANIYFLKSDLGKAIKTFSTLTAAQSTDGRFHGYFGRARALLQLGDLDQALRDINAAITICPDEQGYCIRGDIYVERKQPEQAIEAYTLADRLCPHWHGLLESRALAFEALGKAEEAERDRAACKAIKDQEDADCEVVGIISQIRAQGGTLTVTKYGELDVKDIRLAGSALEDVRRLKPKIIEYLQRRG